jgi:hypothetical protein
MGPLIHLKLAALIKLPREFAVIEYERMSGNHFFQRFDQYQTYLAGGKRTLSHLPFERSVFSLTNHAD